VSDDKEAEVSGLISTVASQKEQKDRLKQLEEEVQRLKSIKVRLEQDGSSSLSNPSASSSHDSAQEQQVAADRAHEYQSSQEEVNYLEVSMVGASSLASVSVPTSQGAADVPPADTIQHSSMVGASSLGSVRVASRQGA